MKLGHLLKKMLTIIRWFEKWDVELQNDKFEVRIDHKNSEYFMTVKKLTERQIQKKMKLTNQKSRKICRDWGTLSKFNQLRPKKTGWISININWRTWKWVGKFVGNGQKQWPRLPINGGGNQGRKTKVIYVFNFKILIGDSSLNNNETFFLKKRKWVPLFRTQLI